MLIKREDEFSFLLKPKRVLEYFAEDGVLANNIDYQPMQGA